MDEKAETVDLYKTMLATIAANEQRRQQISSIFLSLIGVGAAAAAALSDQFDPIYVAVPGLFLSFVWWSQIRFLKRLSKVKWDVVMELEKGFTAKPFTDEWAVFTKGAPKATLSDIESLVPALCFFVCVGYILAVLLAQ